MEGELNYSGQLEKVVEMKIVGRLIVLSRRKVALPVPPATEQRPQEFSLICSGSGLPRAPVVD